jgi:hypothetical protein
LLPAHNFAPNYNFSGKLANFTGVDRIKLTWGMSLYPDANPTDKCAGLIASPKPPPQVKNFFSIADPIPLLKQQGEHP